MESTPSGDIIQISLLSTIPSQTKQVMRESAYNAPLSACHHTLLLAYQHDSSLLAFQHTLHLASQPFSLLTLSPGYIKHTEDMEATGQG